jgi:hypothetical protein
MIAYILWVLLPLETEFQLGAIYSHKDNIDLGKNIYISKFGPNIDFLLEQIQLDDELMV